MHICQKSILPPPKVDVQIDGITVDLNETAYVNDDNVIMIPALAVLEAIGATGVWQPAEKTLKARYDDVSIRVKADTSVLYVDGEGHNMQSPAVVKNDRLYLPAADLLGAIGIRSKCKPDSGVVTITTTETQ